MMQAMTQPLLDHLWQSTLFAADRRTPHFFCCAAIPRASATGSGSSRRSKFLFPFSLAGVPWSEAWGGGPLLRLRLPDSRSWSKKSFVPRAIHHAVFDHPGGRARVSSRRCSSPYGHAGLVSRVVLFLLVARMAAPSGTAPARGSSTAARDRDLPYDVSSGILEPGHFWHPGVPVLLLPERDHRPSHHPRNCRRFSRTNSVTCAARGTNLGAANSHDRRSGGFLVFIRWVWWIERAGWSTNASWACDEEVLRLGNEPQSYAEGILKVCEFCIASPLGVCIGSHRLESYEANRSHHGGSRDAQADGSRGRLLLGGRRESRPWQRPSRSAS